MVIEGFKFNPRIYCECGEGWRELVTKLFQKIQEYLDKYGGKFEVLQAKEKFGKFNLYFSYTGNTRDKGLLYNLIRKYEEISLTICETCGESGKLRNNNNWLYVACDKHDKIGV